MKKIKSIILGILLIVSILTVINPVSAYSIQDAIDAAPVGGTVIVPAGTYYETININKAITLQGADKSTTIIMPAANGTQWISIQASGVHIKNLTFDGTGYAIRQAITTRGSGSITNCVIKNIKQTKYVGIGIYIHYDTSGQDWQIVGNEFLNIERIGVTMYTLGNKATISSNIFQGKGDGDWVEYAIQVEESSLAYIDDNKISNYRGVASSDGSTSAGILVSSYFGPNSTAYITNNTISKNTTAINVGYLEGDTSKVTAKYNTICNNDNDIINVKGTILEASGNRGCPKDFPMNNFLSIFKKNFEKNHGNGGNANDTD